MAWTAPRTWVAGELVTAALMNTHVRDNLLVTGVAKVTTAGDTTYATAANVVARLAIGAATGARLGPNAALNAPEWVGAPVSATVATSQGTASTSFTDLATAGPTVTITTGTKAIVIVSAGMTNTNAGAYTTMGVDVSSATTIAATDLASLFIVTAANYENRASAVLTFGLGGAGGALTAGSNVFRAHYKVSAGTGTFRWRDITVIPI